MPKLRFFLKNFISKQVLVITVNENALYNTLLGKSVKFVDGYFYLVFEIENTVSLGAKLGT